MNQVQFGNSLSVTKQTISNWENDNILPSIDMLMKITKKYGVSADFLLGTDDRKTVDVSGLNFNQITHVQNIIDDIRKG